MSGRCSRTVIRRAPEQALLHAVVREHLETFLAEVRARGDGQGLPSFVERELREFLTCGAMARGFARFQCGGCRREILVAFSCKGRGFCPSCCGRRMCELAAHLVDGVLGGLPVRQWVLTLPHRLRYKLAYDHRLCRAVLGVFARALLGFERRRARERGAEGRGGAVTAIQRCGSALNTNIHFHTLMAEGVFEGGVEGPLRFVPSLSPPSDVEVARLLVAVRRRIVRLVRRHGVELENGEGGDSETADLLSLDSPALATIQGASVLGRVATGPRAGRWVVRLGHDPRAPVVITGGPRQAHYKSFDLHANTAVGAGERTRLEHLCRYILRPPLAQDALKLSEDGKVLLRLRRPWSDGTHTIRFEPGEFLEKLAAMIPRPRTKLLIYHGAFAPRGRCHELSRGGAGVWRAVVEPLPADAQEATAAGVPGLGGEEHGLGPPTGVRVGGAPRPSARPPPPPPRAGYCRPRHYAWADLLRRTFAVDVLACPECGGRLRLLATVAQREVIEKILTHLGLPTQRVQPAPAALEADLFGGVAGYIH